MASGDPRFSDEESALILHRAAELQAQQGRALSLTELESAAAEAGIDTALVRRAAEELAVRGGPPPTAAAPLVPADGGVLGAPLTLVHERTVSGELGPDAWEDAMGEIRRQLDLKGQIDAVGRQFSWSNTRGRRIRVSIVPRGGGHLIRVEERISDLGGGLFLGMGLPMTFAGLGFILPICIVVLQAPVLIPLALALWGAASFGLARTIFKSIAQQRDRDLRSLADGLQQICSDATRRRLPPASS